MAAAQAPDERLKALGTRVRTLRTSGDRTQERLAEHAEITREYLNGIENGSRNPTYDVLHRLAAALGISLSELVKDL